MSEHDSDRTEPPAVDTGTVNPAITERNLRQTEQIFAKSIKSFNEVTKDNSDLAVAKSCFNDVERCYAEVFEFITAITSSLDAKNDLEKFEDIDDKLDLTT